MGMQPAKHWRNACCVHNPIAGALKHVVYPGSRRACAHVRTAALHPFSPYARCKTKQTKRERELSIIECSEHSLQIYCVRDCVSEHNRSSRQRGERNLQNSPWSNRLVMLNLVRFGFKFSFGGRNDTSWALNLNLSRTHSRRSGCWVLLTNRWAISYSYCDRVTHIFAVVNC